MKRALILSLVMCLAAGMAFAKSYELQKKAGDYGKTVTDAKVTVNYTMPPMSGMAPMSYKIDSVLKGEKYQSTLKFSMSGSWNVEVKITQAGKTTPVKFNVDVK
jgi:hypothetical protein